MLSRRRANDFLHSTGALVCGLCVLALPWTAMTFPAVLLERAGAANRPFPVPDQLRDAIRFWRSIFTQHPSHQAVLHDRENMAVVWSVIDLPRQEDGKVDPLGADKLIRSAEKELKARLQRLENDLTPVDEEDKVILALTGGTDPHDIAQRLEGAWMRVRTQQGVADQFRLGMQRSKQWLESIHAILEQQGVPAEIAALPFVESMFNPTARSSAGAAGLWQLMPGTARGLQLKVQRGNDERLDVLKASSAAARMLKNNFEMLGSWPLAITAYNHGPYGVRRAVRSLGSTDLMYLIDNYKKSSWGFASKNFYAEFLAVIAILAEERPEATPEAKVALEDPTARAGTQLID